MYAERLSLLLFFECCFIQAEHYECLRSMLRGSIKDSIVIAISVINLVNLFKLLFVNEDSYVL